MNTKGQPIVKLTYYTLSLSIGNTLIVPVLGNKEMRNIVQETKCDNKYNGDFGSFNRIKRSSLVRSDDAVETIKRHAEYEESWTECEQEEQSDRQAAGPVVIGRHVYVVGHVEVNGQTCRKIHAYVYQGDLLDFFTQKLQ